MKTLKFILFFTITTLFVACTPADEDAIIDVNAQKEDLIGTWNLIAITQDGTSTTTVEGIPIQSQFSSYGKDIDAQVTFSTNPNSFTSSGSYTSVVTITLAGQSNSYEETIEIGEFLNLGDWSLNEGILTVSKENESNDIYITELNSSTLKLEMDFEQIVDVEGVKVTTKAKVKMTLVK